MAIIRRTMENIRRMKPRINRAKIDATTEADIRRQIERMAGASDFANLHVGRPSASITQAAFG